jgi:UDP:flavonoid glycosyltransferase YjiC (YdhE family)
MALGKALMARGYQVRMAVNPAIHTLVQLAGLEAVALPEPRMGPEQVRQHAHAWDHWEETGDSEASEAIATLFRAYGVERNFPLLRALLSLCQDADLLLATSIRPWGWVVHQALGLPWLTISVVPAQFGTPPADHPSRTHDWEAAKRLFHHHVQDWLRQVLLRLAPTLKPTCAHGPLWSDELLLASSPHFSPSSGTVSPAHAVTVHSTGFWFYDDPVWCNWEPAPALRRFVERRPLVLSFSSLPVVNPSEVLTVHVQAAEMLGRPLLVQAGWAGFSAALLPGHLRTADVMFADFLPHDWLFAQAACAIQHGGIGSIARALRQGCPLLIEPYGNDQFFNAMQVIELEVGAAMHPGKLTAEGIVRVLAEKVLSPVYRRRAEAIGAHIRLESGLETACQHIDRIVRSSQPCTQLLWPSGAIRHHVRPGDVHTALECQ